MSCLFWRIIHFLDIYAGAVTAIATAFIALFTYFLIRVSSRQAELISKQVELGREEFTTTSRAFIFIEGFDARLYPLDSQEGEQPGEMTVAEGRTLNKALIPTYFSVQPRWRNSGSTPTKDMKISVQCNFFTDGFKPDFAFNYESLPERHFVGPNAIEASKSIEIGCGPALQIIFFENNIPLGSGVTHPFLIIYGCADYSDIFNELHFVKWCYRIGFSRPPGQRLSATFTQYGEYNDEGTYKRRAS